MWGPWGGAASFVYFGYSRYKVAITRCVRFLMAALAKLIDADRRRRSCRVRRCALLCAPTQCLRVSANAAQRALECMPPEPPSCVARVRSNAGFAVCIFPVRVHRLQSRMCRCTSGVETFVFPIPAGCGRSAVDTPFETASSRSTSSVVRRGHPGSTSPQRWGNSSARKPGERSLARHGRRAATVVRSDACV